MQHTYGRSSSYIDSPPSKSPGRKELREEGVALACSAESSPVVPQRLAEALLGQPVLHVSAPEPGCLPEPRHAPEEPPCWLDICWRIALVSHSLGFSASIVVLPSTQLFRAVWAFNKRGCKNFWCSTRITIGTSIIKMMLKNMKMSILFGKVFTADEFYNK